VPGWDSLEVIVAEYSSSLSIFKNWREKCHFVYLQGRTLPRKSLCRQLVSTLDHYNTCILQLKFVYLMNIFKETFVSYKWAFFLF